MVLRSMVLALGLLVSTKAVANEQVCLALTAFTEAKGEGEYAMALVAHTVLNRAAKTGKTICQIAYAPNQYHGVLHWPKQRDPARHSPVYWREAMQAASDVMADRISFAACTGATHFYAPKLVKAPRWAHKLPFKCEYNGHKFYRE